MVGIGDGIVGGMKGFMTGYDWARRKHARNLLIEEQEQRKVGRELSKGTAKALADRPNQLTIDPETRQARYAVTPPEQAAPEQAQLPAPQQAPGAYETDQATGSTGITPPDQAAPPEEQGSVAKGIADDAGKMDEELQKAGIGTGKSVDVNTGWTLAKLPGWMAIYRGIDQRGAKMGATMEQINEQKEMVSENRKRTLLEHSSLARNAFEGGNFCKAISHMAIANSMAPNGASSAFIIGTDKDGKPTLHAVPYSDMNGKAIGGGVGYEITGEKITDQAMRQVEPKAWASLEKQLNAKEKIAGVKAAKDARAAKRQAILDRNKFESQSIDAWDLSHGTEYGEKSGIRAKAVKTMNALWGKSPDYYSPEIAAEAAGHFSTVDAVLQDTDGIFPGYKPGSGQPAYGITSHTDPETKKDFNALMVLDDQGQPTGISHRIPRHYKYIVEYFNKTAKSASGR